MKYKPSINPFPREISELLLFWMEHTVI